MDIKRSAAVSPVLTALLSLALVGVAACTPTPKNDAMPTPTMQPTTSKPYTKPAPSIAPLPEADPRRKTLGVVEAKTGSGNAGVFMVEPGDLWLISDCYGGAMTIYVDPGVELPLQCATDSVTPTGSKVAYSVSKQVSVRVVATEGVHWNLRIEQ
ncbi:hypothetical protein [Catelliglobosispora koreensis]|uniref:hypothetical protein n=1 Tax=Catelliglobosispora koreensis TaxID=129052 RepID=UPI00036D1553|nr:hypothetical protein [Catelliglobosispora koreensis]